MNWLKHAVVFRLPLGDAPKHARAYIQEEITDDENAFWIVSKGRNRSRLSTDGVWLEHPGAMIKLDMAKTIPERMKELDDYRRRTSFETKEQALDAYIAWRRSQGDMTYAPGCGA